MLRRVVLVGLYLGLSAWSSRDARAVVPPQDDALAQQTRNRKIARISSALQVVVNKMTAR